MLELIWTVPLLPLLGVAVNGLFGRRMSRRAVGILACAVIAAAFVVACGAVWQLAQSPAGERHFERDYLTWMPLDGAPGHAAGLNVAWGFALDELSAVMLLMVTGVGLLIHVYSTGYMSHEPDHARFFVYMNLFMSMMLLLILGNNLLVLFVGWEGVGLCSYLLIGFFYDQPFDRRSGVSCADAGRKAFIVNRIGDFAFLLGILYLAVTFGTLKFSELGPAIAGSHADALLTAIALLLFVGACGKSAQIPLYVWLPDAMAGPTPVSALIHAATMVTAGVYMVCRMSVLYSHAPGALGIVATVGALTALFAATMGLCATDIKKVLAYSTVSQLGYMFAAAGVGAYVAAIFHLITHAFFKALLFLGAGSVIHGLGGEQDIRRMGDVRSKMPATYRTFLVAWLAIAGIFPFAGFFSKDEILAGAWSSGSTVVWSALLVGAFVTAFYMTRLVWLVFFGRYRGERETWDHAHESPRSMTVPLGILAVLSVAGGWIGIPAVMWGWIGSADHNVFHHWLEHAITPVGAHGAHAAAHPGAGLEALLIGVALAVAIGGILVGLAIYRREERPARIARAAGPFYTMVRNLYWVDELYDAAVLRPFYAVSRALSTFDKWVVDGAVNVAGLTAKGAGEVVKYFQTGLVRNYALLFLLGVMAILYYLATV